MTVSLWWISQVSEASQAFEAGVWPGLTNISPAVGPLIQQEQQGFPTLSNNLSALYTHTHTYTTKCCMTTEQQLHYCHFLNAMLSSLQISHTAAWVPSRRGRRWSLLTFHVQHGVSHSSYSFVWVFLKARSKSHSGFCWSFAEQTRQVAVTFLRADVRQFYCCTCQRMFHTTPDSPVWPPSQKKQNKKQSKTKNLSGAPWQKHMHMLTCQRMWLKHNSLYTSHGGFFLHTQLLSGPLLILCLRGFQCNCQVLIGTN